MNIFHRYTRTCVTARQTSGVRMIDAGYVTVTPELNFKVSRRIWEEYENGRHYYALHGRRIAAPER